MLQVEILPEFQRFCLRRKAIQAGDRDQQELRSSRGSVPCHIDKVLDFGLAQGPVIEKEFLHVGTQHKIGWAFEGSTRE